MRSLPETTRILLSLALTGALSACGASDSSTTPEAAPEQQFRNVYDVTLSVDDIQISPYDACDGTNIYGKPDPGEFQYRIEVVHNGQMEVSGSPGYGSVKGNPNVRAPSHFIGHTSAYYPYLDSDSTDATTIRLRGTEWDGFDRDSSLDDVSASKTLVFGRTSVGRHADAISIGNNDCGMTLRYAYDVAVKRVPVT